jgi:hypothetical protein
LNRSLDAAQSFLPHRCRRPRAGKGRKRQSNTASPPGKFQPRVCYLQRSAAATRRAGFSTLRKTVELRVNAQNPLCHSDKYNADNLNKDATSKIASDCAHERCGGFARLFSRFYFKLKHSA